MQQRTWLAGLSAAALALTGICWAGPLAGSAQQSATPPAAQTVTSDEQQGVTPIVGTPLLVPAIDLTRAQEIALESQAGAVVTELDLDGDEGKLTYSIILDSGVEVDVDATSGEILKTGPSDERDGQEEDGEGEDANGDSDEQEDDGADDGEDEAEGENATDQG